MLTAYGSGMFDDLGTDHPGYAKPENQLNFGLSMGLNFIGGGLSKGVARGILYDEISEKLVTGFIPSIKAYGKTIVDETLINKHGKIAAILESYFEEIWISYFIDLFINNGK